MPFYYTNIREVRAPPGTTAIVADFHDTEGMFGYLVLNTPYLDGVEHRIRRAIMELAPDEANTEQHRFEFFRI